MLINSLGQIKASMQGIYKLALGGTAVGTGINAPKNFDRQVAKKIAELTDEPFITEGCACFVQRCIQGTCSQHDEDSKLCEMARIRAKAWSL